MPRITLRKRRGSRRQREKGKGQGKGKDNQRQNQSGGAATSAKEWIGAVKKLLESKTFNKLGDLIQEELKLPPIADNNDFVIEFNGKKEDIRRQGDAANVLLCELFNVTQDNLKDVELSKCWEMLTGLYSNVRNSLRNELIVNFLTILEGGLSGDVNASIGVPAKNPLFLMFLIMNVTFEESQLLPQSVDLAEIGKLLPEN